MSIQEVEKITADKNGIIELQIEGRSRRFVKEKLVTFLLNNPESLPAANVVKIKRQAARPPKKPAKKNREVSKTKVDNVAPKKQLGETRRKPVIAILPDGTEQQFASRKFACDALGINNAKASNISRVIKGVYHHVQGIKFKNVQQLTA